MNPTNAIVQLNKYDREKYNVLVPVTTMQVASNLQRITVSEVQLDVRQNSSNNGRARTSTMRNPAAPTRSRRSAA